MKYLSFTGILSIAVGLVLALTLTGCQPEAEASDKIGVVVTILPQADFVEAVGGDRITVTVMVPPGASPHTYEPTPSQMTALSEAKMYAKVGSGIEFELVWMDKLLAVNKEMLVVDCSEGITLIEMGAPHEHEENEHGHEGMDPHIWMSPLNVKIMVENICDGLIQVDPEGRAYYEDNRDTYLQELTQLDQDIRDGLSAVANRTFMVYHPAFGYFAREYNLIMLSVAEEGKEPTAAGITSLIEQAGECNIKTIFVSPQFNAESAEVIAGAIDGRVVFIDSLAEDYIFNLRVLLGELIQAME